MNRTIVLEAAPFCFGPISTLLSVAQALESSGRRLVMIEEGPTADLARRDPCRCERRGLSTRRPFSDELSALVRGADLVVSDTDPEFARECLEIGARVVVIDTLFWMWDRLDDAVLESDLYLVPEFPGVDEQLRRLGRPRNLRRVGPLVAPQGPPIARSERTARILLSLGGSDCPFVAPGTDLYPGSVLEQALAVAGGEVLVATGERAAAELAPYEGRARIRTLSRAEHLEEIRRARAALVSPGLTAALEVFEAGTPVFFLPPQNYSQVLQLEVFTRAGAAAHRFAWSDAWAEPTLEPWLPEERAVARVREWVERFGKDREAQARFREKLAAFLAADPEAHDPAPGLAFRRSLGEGGPGRAAEAILEVLG